MAGHESQHYEAQGYALLPDRYVREGFIEDQWDDILRFVATVQLKVTTASQLFKRLNSYSRQHPLYQALKGIREDSKNPLYPEIQ